MNNATLAQGNQILNLILQKKKTSDELQQLLGGVLSDVLDANLSLVNRRELRRFLCIPPIAEVYTVLSVNDSVVSSFVRRHGKYRDSLSALPKDMIVTPEARLGGVSEEITVLSLTCEDFLSPDDEEIDRNITEQEALREMKRRGYTPCGMCEMVDLLIHFPKLKDDRYLSLVAFEPLHQGEEEDILCSVVWQVGHLAVRNGLRGTCGNNCRFLAKRNY